MRKFTLRQVHKHWDDMIQINPKKVVAFVFKYRPTFDECIKAGIIDKTKRDLTAASNYEGTVIINKNGAVWEVTGTAPVFNLTTLVRHGTLIKTFLRWDGPEEILELSLGGKKTVKKH